MPRTFPVLAFLTVVGCQNPAEPPVDIQGSWAADISTPGANLVLDLTQDARTITGGGTYAIEAGRAGTVQVEGSYDPPSIVLPIRYDYDRTATFTGTVLDSHHMSGTMADGSGEGTGFSFTRR